VISFSVNDVNLVKKFATHPVEYFLGDCFVGAPPPSVTCGGGGGGSGGGGNSTFG